VGGLDSPSAALRPRESTDLLGLHERSGCFGLGVPFGAADAETFEQIAALCEQFGDGLVKLLPARALLLSGVIASAAPALIAAVRRAGLIAESDHLLANVVACAGAPACASAHGETRRLARELAECARPLITAGASLHVSGCSKGCAQSTRADLTVVHASSGPLLGVLADVAETAGLCASSALASGAELGVQVRALAREYAIAAPHEAARTFLARYRARPPRRQPELAPKPSSMKRTYDYERNPAEIYRRSFSIIRAEAKLGRFSPSEERVAVRLIHTAGMVELADDIVFSPGFTEAASAALRAGKPVLCDANMIVSGVTRARLSAQNDVLCFLGAPGLSELARELHTTRSAAALSLWKEHLDGAVVAIGNAPTALFRLLELLDETDARPAAVIGVPVGFVGAAESKEALLADGRIPALIVRGRKGGSAMAVAAINALASEEE
jgi:precorrin-8X/cobalt-precorrin-8 methylmutase